MVLVLVKGQQGDDNFQELKDKIRKLKTRTNAGKVDEGENRDISSILHILKNNENSDSTRDKGSIHNILSIKCKTSLCQEEKNNRVVAFILNDKETIEKTDGRDKLRELSLQLDKLIPTQEIQPKRRLREPTGQKKNEQPRSSGARFRQFRGAPSNLGTLFPDDDRNIFIISLEGSQNPRFIFEK